MSAVLDNLRPETFEQHSLHSSDSVWPNTNCYLDVWIEVLSSLGLDPVPALASAISADFIGDQWEFLKVRLEDLETLYGIRVGEYDTWRPILEHVEFQRRAGNLTIIEVDSFYLPDTRGVSYQLQHTKSSIVPVIVDPERETLTYFHNEGLHSLAGEDFRMIFGPEAAHGLVPKPYVELIRLDRLTQPSAEAIWKVFSEHVARIAPDNPMESLNAFVLSQCGVLAERDLDYFHDFGFATTRQAGLTSMLAAAYCTRLAELEPPGGGDASADLTAAAEAFQQASEAAKKLQFQLARVASGRSPDLAPIMQTLAHSWAEGIALIQKVDVHV